MSVDKQWERLESTYSELGDTEREVLATIAERLLAGQKAYGKLYRAKKDWAMETFQEACDAAVYTAVAMVELRPLPNTEDDR